MPSLILGDGDTRPRCSTEVSLDFHWEFRSPQREGREDGVGKALNMPISHNILPSLLFSDPQPSGHRVQLSDLSAIYLFLRQEQGNPCPQQPQELGAACENTLGAVGERSLGLGKGQEEVLASLMAGCHQPQICMSSGLGMLPEDAGSLSLFPPLVCCGLLEWAPKPLTKEARSFFSERKLMGTATCNIMPATYPYGDTRSGAQDIRALLETFPCFHIALFPSVLPTQQLR